MNFEGKWVTQDSLESFSNHRTIARTKRRSAGPTSRGPTKQHAALGAACDPAAADRSAAALGGSATTTRFPAAFHSPPHRPTSLLPADP